MKMEKFRIYNAVKFKDKKTNADVVLLECNNIGKETRFPKRIRLTVDEAVELLGEQLKDEFALGFNQKIIEVQELYRLTDE